MKTDSETDRLRRRDFLRVLGIGGSGLILSERLRAAETGRKRRPNILLILTDDQGWGDIRSHGNDLIDSPVMDSLAASGARFDRFYVSPVCAPTRAGLLTGRYPYRTGVSGVTHGKETMRPNEVTIAELLKKHGGYVTGCFGKWHNGAHYPYSPNGKGFDEFLGFCAGHWNNYFDTSLERNGRPVRTRGYISDVLTDAALKFMEAYRERPFFCYVPYNAPHSPNQVPDRYFDKYKARDCDDETATVYGMCENLDDNIGRLLAKLEELSLTEDTVVLFLTDNGPNSDRFNGGMRSRKGGLHEGGVRVPCFISWPGHIRAGRTIESIAAHIDILPTLAELAGIREYETPPLDGASLVPLLEGKGNDWPERMLFNSWGGQGAVRTQTDRLFVDRDGSTELYDMRVDPGETEDISGKYPDTAARLKRAYDEWYRDVTANGLEAPPTPVGYPQYPVVELPGHEAALSGSVRYYGGQGWANDWVTGWTDTGATARWDIDVVRTGSYEITLMYTCPAADIGATVRVEAGGKGIEGRIAKAHDPEPVASPDRIRRKEVYEKVWAPLRLGLLELPSGRTNLTVRALTKPGKAVMDLKAVRVRLVL